jgi:hypothetical protein
LDYETYYEKGTKAYSLKNKELNNEGYIFSKLFQVHGCGVAIDNEAPEFLTHNELVRFFAGLDWSKVVLISHNALFDAAITAWRYRKVPAVYVDTMGLANQFIRPYCGLAGLKACCEFEGWPGKDGTLDDVANLRTEHILMRPGLWDRLGEYCKLDVENCRRIFTKYYKNLSDEDRAVMDWAVRNYVHIRLRLDVPLLTKLKVDIAEDRDQMAREAGIPPDVLRSTKKFAEYLESQGVEVEYKEGKNDAEIPAISKTDPFVRQCLDSGNEQLVRLMKARLTFSSTAEKSRVDRLIRLAGYTNGHMLLPTLYAAAHTGRIGGTHGINPTNIRKRTPEDKAQGKKILRDAILPPKGMVFLEVDASQAEARIIAWLSECQPMLDAFRDPNRDFYCEVGFGIYKEMITKADPRRQQAKITALAAQYGLGKVTLAKRLNAIGIPATEDDADILVQGYRRSFPEVLANGQEFINRLKWCTDKETTDSYKNFGFAKGHIFLPSGRALVYHSMIVHERRLKYWSHKYRNYQELYSGAVNENIAQALTHDLVKRTLARFRRDAISFIYDAVTRIIVPEAYEERAAETIASMRTTPRWAEGLPLDAEAKLKECW